MVGGAKLQMREFGGWEEQAGSHVVSRARGSPPCTGSPVPRFPLLSHRPHSPPPRAESLSGEFVGVPSPEGSGKKKANHRVDQQGSVEELTSLRQAGRGRLVLQFRGWSRFGFLGLRQKRRLPFRGHDTREVARGQRPDADSRKKLAGTEAVSGAGVLSRPRSRPARGGYLHDSGTHTPTPLLPASLPSLQSAETSLSCSRRGLPGVGGGGGFSESSAPPPPLNPGLHWEARGRWPCPPPRAPALRARPPSRVLPLSLHSPVWSPADSDAFCCLTSAWNILHASQPPYSCVWLDSFRACRSPLGGTDECWKKRDSRTRITKTAAGEGRKGLAHPFHLPKRD